MNSIDTNIKTTKLIYPQIYAYTTPSIPENKGWVKIGYTERKNVDDRIREQTHTAGIKFNKLWSEPAKFINHDKWFKDKEFHSYLRKFKHINQRPHTEWFYYKDNINNSHKDFDDFRHNKKNQIIRKVQYTLRPEQKKAVEVTLDYANKNLGGEFLWNAKPRFGKTLTTYDFVRKLNASKVLIVTNRPAVSNSWFDDFDKFISWQTNFAFISTSDSLKNRSIMTRDDFIEQIQNGKDKMIAFISLQDLKGSISFGGSYDKLSWVKKLNWDLLVIDESHEGVDTLKTDIAFKNINRNFTLYLSGTPFKAVSSGKFSINQIYNWTYSDEQESKYNWSKHNDDINPYISMPRLNMFSYQMSNMITDEVNKGANIDGENKEFAFDLNEFFDTNESGKFIHENDVKKWLDTLSHNKKYPFSTYELRNKLKHTFWLLNRVASAKALKRLLNKHLIFKNYKVIVAAGDGKTNDEQVISQKSIDRVKKAINENDKTITISVGQLTTGVTIPEWTAVMMLSNLKSPSEYMQAAFRSQNPWVYESNGEIHQKNNSYIFDFAPERTLSIYDEFANDLYKKTSNGSGNVNDHKDNIRKLLNFFPVISEDKNGEMIKLDVNEVLTIPKKIKAREVVSRGFMSNLLFKNVYGIFSSSGAKEILSQLNPVDEGKSFPRKTNDIIDTKNVVTDEDGNVEIDPEIVISTTNANFGNKIYSNIEETIESGIKNNDKLSRIVSKNFIDNISESVNNLSKEYGVTMGYAKRVLNKNSNIIAREIELIQKDSNIKKSENKIEYKRIISNSYNNSDSLIEAKSNYDAKNRQIDDELRSNVISTVEKRSKELVSSSTKDILKKSEKNKKNIVENDTRSRLRGFSRTIPSFLMAYGDRNTNLSNFDKVIKNDVFKEVTGISLDQFRELRDVYNFFDEAVFNESVNEFLNKRNELSDYFSKNKTEDIFDYIPPQQNNQIFTPKKIVKLMIDKLQNENPEDFKNPNKKFADLYVKSGLYLTEIVKRLYVGLEDKIPDSDSRLKHILENQIYGFAPNDIIYNIALNFIYGFDNKAQNFDKSHIVCLDTIPFSRGEGDFESKCDELFGGNNDEI